jgi:hypothetical protein
MQAASAVLSYDLEHRQARAGRSSFGWVRAGLGCAAAIAALVLLARETSRNAPSPALPAARPPAVLVAPAPSWQPIGDAKPHYALDLAELKGLSATHEARRHAKGGREDKLAYGIFESEQAYLRVAVFRGPQEAERPASFFLDLARRAGEAGLAVVRSGRIGTVETKLGTMETAEAVLSDSVERACLAFRLRHAELGLAVHGWHCAGAEAQAPSHPVCIVDRLAVLPAAEDQALKVLFAQAERRRHPACGAPTEVKRKTA